MGHCNKIAVPHDTCQCHFEHSEEILFLLSNILFSTEVRAETSIGNEESTREEVVCGRNEAVEMDVWCYEAGQNKELEGQRKWDKYPRKYVKVVGTCNEKRRICG